jgi:hypothetical protein
LGFHCFNSKLQSSAYYCVLSLCQVISLFSAHTMHSTLLEKFTLRSVYLHKGSSHFSLNTAPSHYCSFVIPPHPHLLLTT